MAKKLGSGEQGWAPSAYLKEEPQPPPTVAAIRSPPPPPPPVANGTAARTKPGPPVPPNKRPIGKKLAPTPGSRDSAISVSSVDSERATPESSRSSSTPSLAGGLAEALRARQASMLGKQQHDEKDDW